AFDALGHELVLGKHVVLEIAVLGVGLGFSPTLHGAQRSHAAEALVLLGDVAGVLQSAVGDHRHTGRAADRHRFQNRSDLWRSDAGHHAGGANRPGTNADFDS